MQGAHFLYDTQDEQVDHTFFLKLQRGGGILLLQF